jgi:outer membrane cobalamin receptor
MNQVTHLDKRYYNYQFNSDFTAPLGKVGNLETGLQLIFNEEQENYSSEITPPQPPQTTAQETKFNGVVAAGYGTWQIKIKKFDLKAGLRAEYLNREMVTTHGNYPVRQFDLYPSLNSSFKIDSAQVVILNYSRRTDQLKTIQLDPLPRWYNFYNVMVGNPNLVNEITDKIALDYLINFPRLILVNELYLYNTANKIEVIQSIYQGNMIQNRYENSGSEKTWGFEINANWTVNQWIRLSEKLDFIDSHLNVSLEPIAGKKRYQQWYSVSTAEFTISPTTLLELDFSYYGPAMTSQSSIDAIYMAGLSVRQTFFDRKLTFTLSGRDVMGFYKKAEHVLGNNFNQAMTIENRFPVSCSLSYKFNNYKRNERRVAKSPLTE